MEDRKRSLISTKSKKHSDTEVERSHKESGLSKKKPSKKALIINMVVAGVGVFFTIGALSSIGSGHVSSLAIVALVLGIIAGITVIPGFYRAFKVKEISPLLGVAFGMVAITIVGPLVALIADPIAMNVTCSQYTDANNIPYGMCSDRKAELEAQKAQQEEAEKAKFEEEQNKVREELAGKRYNAENEAYCANLKNTNPSYYTKSYYFEDTKNVTITLCDGNTKTYPYSGSSSGRSFKYNDGSYSFTVSDDGSYIMGAYNQKYTLTAKDQPNSDPSVAPQSTSTSNSSSSTGSSSNSSSTPSSSSNSSSSSSSDWKQFLADYEKWVDSYIAFMTKYKNASSSDLPAMMSDYSRMLNEQAEWTKKLDSIKGTLSGSDLSEYLNTMSRITQKLSQVN